MFWKYSSVFVFVMLFTAWFIREPVPQGNKDSRGGNYHTFSSNAVKKAKDDSLDKFQDSAIVEKFGEGSNDDSLLAKILDAPVAIEAPGCVGTPAVLTARIPVAKTESVKFDARESQNSQPWLDLPS